MDEQINFGISGDVSIKGTNSVKDLNAEFSKVLETIQALKKSTKETNEALKSTSVKKLISDTDVSNMLSSLDGMFKKVESISNKTFEQLSQNIESSLSQSFETAFKKYDELSKKYAARRGNEVAYSQYRHRQNQSYGFTPITSQVSQRQFAPAYDEISAYRQRHQNSMLSLTQYGVRNSGRLNLEASERRIESMVRKMRFEEKTGITDSMSKEIEDYDKLLSELASKHNEKVWSDLRKDTETAFRKYDTSAKDKYYKQQHDKRVKDRYYREQHNARYERWQNSPNSGNWYTNETGFLMGPNHSPYGEGQQLAERVHQAQKERAEAEQRIAEQTREHLRQITEQSRFLLTADAGIKKVKDENLLSEEAIEIEKKQQLEAEKENTEKVKKMTEFQKEKIRVADDENKIRQDRIDVERAESERKSARDNSGYNQYRNAHPELFAVGALYHSKRYQTGHAFQSLGGVASTLGSGGRAVGLALDSLGAFFKAVPLGIATTISNLAKGITELGRASVQAYSEIEAIKTQLGVVFSNQTQADSMFGNIAQYAVRSPFGVQQTSELAVLLKQSGVYASDLMNTLKMLGDTAGGNMEKMKRIANNYAQIMAIGKASMLDMRQFAYAGIPIFEAVSKELGVSQQELRKLISDGKVTSDIIEKVFKDLTGINGIFENATEKGAKTLKARLQNLSDARQLALGELGERVVNSGRQTGNDSYVIKTVSWMEKLYSGLESWLDRGNIAKDVKIIANRNSRIDELEKLISYNSDNKEVRELLERELKLELAKRDYDVERNTYAQSYDAKTGRLERAFAALGGFEYGDVNSRINQLGGANVSWLKNIPNVSMLFGNNFYGAIEKHWSDITTSDEYKGMSDDQQKELKNLFEELIAAMKEYNSLTEEDLRANRERNLQNAQQSAFDLMNKQGNASGSLLTSFQELSSIYKGTDSYKEKEEKKRTDTLTKALEILKDIKKNTDDEGRVDITKFSASQLSNYIQQGAFTASERLNVVTGNTSVDKKNREDLMKQYGYIAELAGNFMKVALPDARYSEKTAQFEGSVLDSLKTLSDTEFYEQFPKTYEQQTKALDELINGLSENDGRKQMLQMYRSLLDYSLNRIETDVTGADATTGDLSTSKNEFIPLWKRILAGSTGLSTQGMTGTEQTLKNYRDDMAIRNMTAGVLSATLKTMGVDSAMSLVKTSGYAKQLRRDASNTFQVDWQKTRQSVKDFSLSLSAATEVVSAYKKGLEDELDVYQQLIVAGYTESESQDLKNQKTVSSKTMAKLAMDSGEQLVNAFGEILTTKSGKQYNVSDISIVNGQLVDKLGNPIEEEVILTGRMFEFIKQEMPRLYEELHEANMQEQNNAALEKMFGSLSSTMFTSMMIKEHGVNNITGYLANNPEYIDSLLKSGISMYQSETRLDDKTKQRVAKWDKLSGLSTADIILAANNYTGKNDIDSVETQANAVVRLVLDSIVENADKLLNSSEYKSLSEGLKNQSRDDAINNALMELTSFVKNRSQGLQAITSGGNVINNSTSLSPEDYGGNRGARNFFLKYGLGYEQKYDLEDLYIQAAKTKNLEGQGVNQFGIDSSRFDQYKGLKNEGELILENLNEQEKAWIRITAAQKESAVVLTEFSNTMTGVLADFGKGLLVKPTEQLTKNLVLGNEATKDMSKVYKSLSSEILNASAAAMQKAGWELVARGAAKDSIPMIAGGLALAGAGGVVAGLGSALSESNDNKDNDKTKKLEDLKNNLAELLKQAREDAIYYEKTLRHKKAVSANEAFTKSVNDAIITPRGDIVTTDPKDYLIATKTPKTLIGGGAPTINFSVVDKSTGIRVTQQKSTYNAETNSIDFEAVIESKVQEVIASTKGDDAFAAREARLRGHSVIA